MVHIDNIYLKELLKKAGITVCAKTVKNTILPEMVKKVKITLEEKLNKAIHIILIVDLWSNKQMTGFCGLAAMVTYENFERECFVIGLQRIYKRHTAENIKAVFEEIVNEYDFNKSKLKGIVSDEGSNLRRLFKQLADESDESGDTDEADGDFVDLNFDSDEDDDDSDYEEIDENIVIERIKTKMTDVNQYNNDLNKLVLETAELTSELNKVHYDEDEEDLFEKTNSGKPIDNLVLALDTFEGQKLNRFSCCVHKANNSIKKAIKSIPKFHSDLKKLTKWTKSLRKSNPTNEIYQIKSSRLRSEN